MHQQQWKLVHVFHICKGQLVSAQWNGSSKHIRTGQSEVKGHHSSLAHSSNVYFSWSRMLFGFSSAWPKINLFFNIVIDNAVALPNLTNIEYRFWRFCKAIARLQIIPRIAIWLTNGHPAFRRLDESNSTSWIDCWSVMFPERDISFSFAAESV